MNLLLKKPLVLAFALSSAYAAPFFNITSTVDTLCINSTNNNRTYPLTGIKIKTPFVSIANPGIDCKMANNNFCIFSANNQSVTEISLSGLGSGIVDFVLCLNGYGPLSCQNYQITKPINLDNADFNFYDLKQDLESPYRAFSVVPAGITDGAFSSFATAPTNGNYAIVTGFDGSGPGHILLGKDLPAGYSTITFDYRAGWDLVPYGATIDRTFKVRIEPSGGGNTLQETLVLTAVAGTNVNDTGAQTATIDISSFAGRSIRVVFDWYVPQNFTGPALFQLDNVNIF
jgi:hypothetical protein